MFLRNTILTLLLLLISFGIFAVIDTFTFENSEQKELYFILINEIRCPRCQNQAIGDSYAPIAKNLRREVHRLVLEGVNEQGIIDFMVKRYGEFIIYRPLLGGKTLILWLGPIVLLLIGVFSLMIIMRKHRVELGSYCIEKGLDYEQQEKIKNLMKKNMQEGQ